MEEEGVAFLVELALRGSSARRHLDATSWYVREVITFGAVCVCRCVYVSGDVMTVCVL